MPTPSDIHVSCRLERKDPRLPVYAVIPAPQLKPWLLAGTTMVEGTANGVPFGRRTLKAWGKGSDDWFVEFTAPFCKMAQLNVGDPFALTLRRADASTPDALEILLTQDASLMAAWAALTDSQRRDAGEYIRAAKGQGTRDRRAASTAAKLRRRPQQG